MAAASQVLRSRKPKLCRDGLSSEANAARFIGLTESNLSLTPTHSSLLAKSIQELVGKGEERLEFS